MVMTVSKKEKKKVPGARDASRLEPLLLVLVPWLVLVPLLVLVVLLLPPLR